MVHNLMQATTRITVKFLDQPPEHHTLTSPSQSKAMQSLPLHFATFYANSPGAIDISAVVSRGDTRIAEIVYFIHVDALIGAV